MTSTVMTVKSTEVQVGDRLIDGFAGPRCVADIWFRDGLVYFAWKDGGYAGYYKVSDVLEVRRLIKEGN